MFSIHRVTGQSLFPEYLDGDFVVAVKIPVLLKRVRVGDTVIVNHPVYGKLIKKVVLVDMLTEKVMLRGVSPMSVDTEQIGAVSFNCIQGKIILRIGNKGSDEG